jgi:predicted nucleic acid-binding protein
LLGRREASKRRLHVIGTLGVLRTAADQGLLDFRQAIAQLRTTNFRFTQEILDRLIRGEEI